MKGTMNKSENKQISKVSRDSASVEEAKAGGSLGGGGLLKKGPWTSVEDAILVEYVKKHGEGNWNAVQKHSGLSRCGKSCRLRWANHLRPDLKKGAFTPEEERCIIELHSKMGNKWARMAAEIVIYHLVVLEAGELTLASEWAKFKSAIVKSGDQLPGRTDNEIKNYWNTRIKRLQRSGSPIYPADVRSQMKNAGEDNHMGTLSTGDADHQDLLLRDEIPNVELNNFFSHGYLPCLPDFFDNPASSMRKQGVSSSHAYVFPRMHPPKRPRELETLPVLDDSVCSTLPVFNHSVDYTGNQNAADSFNLCTSSDPDLNVTDQSPLSVLSGSHALLNGNSSSSEPIFGAMKLELPSLQYSETQPVRWGMPASPLPSLESVDTLLQSPQKEQPHSDCLSQRNSGLLEAILYESQTLKNSSKNSPQQALDSFLVPGNLVKSLPMSPFETATRVDPNSPLGHSAASVFSEYTPASGSSMDEHQSVETMLGCSAMPRTVNLDPTQYVEKKELSNEMDITRPDAFLDLDGFGHCNEHDCDLDLVHRFGHSEEHAKDESLLRDDIWGTSGWRT